MRPSLRTPILTRPWMPVRARPMSCSSSRLMRIITGAPLSFFDNSAGMVIDTAPAALLPNPPPVYSLTSTTSAGSTPTHDAIGSTVRTRLCVVP